MPQYRLYELDDHEFEQLVGQICVVILGTGTVVFAPGKDGGSDGRFSGTAQLFPSDKSPLSGNFIVQAKHTTNPSARCSDSEFNQIMKKERPKIRNLARNKELDHYLLFTNRRLSGIKEASLRKDLPRDAGDNKIPFPAGEIILDLHDGGPKGRLFKMREF